MKVMKVIGVLAILCSIAYFFSSFFYPLPQGPYGSLIFSINGVVWSLKAIWPRFKAFLGMLPLAVRFLFPIFCALLAFMDIRTSGFTLYGMWVYGLAGLTSAEMLSIKRQ